MEPPDDERIERWLQRNDDEEIKRWLRRNDGFSVGEARAVAAALQKVRMELRAFRRRDEVDLEAHRAFAREGREVPSPYSEDPDRSAWRDAMAQCAEWKRMVDAERAAGELLRRMREALVCCVEEGAQSAGVDARRVLDLDLPRCAVLASRAHAVVEAAWSMNTECKGASSPWPCDPGTACAVCRLRFALAAFVEAEDKACP